jgi:hypothetical protein
MVSVTTQNDKKQRRITMNDPVKRFSWVSVYAIAMAFLEAVTAPTWILMP